MDYRSTWLLPVEFPKCPPTVDIVVGSGMNAIDTTHHDTLLQLKSEIDKIHPIQIWDDAKKITNPYEYIFLSLQKRMHSSIAAIAPLSRSYFKMIEIWDLLRLQPTLDRPLLTAHSAEGPGGFLEAIMHRVAKSARMIAMTLRSTERTIPGWRKSNQFLTAYPTVHVTYGADNTGNLYSLANQTAFAKTAQEHLGSFADIYTADGGFDFSADFNAQENTVQRLLAAEALCGLNVLAVGGTMILKIFDTKHVATLELLWILSGCFEKTAIVKPSTSRPANSERYWIGSRLKPNTPEWVMSVLSELTSTDAPNGWTRIFKQSVFDESKEWVEQLRVFQEDIELQQIHNIQATLNLIKQPSKALIYDLLLENIRKSRTWCENHGIAINRQYIGLSDEQVALSNLEEALDPFQASVVRTNLLALSRPQPTHHVLTSSPSQRTPVGQAWRSTLPASIRGPVSFQTVSDTAPSSDSAPPQSQQEEFLSHDMR
jgi:hypothetical protein